MNPPRFYLLFIVALIGCSCGYRNCASSEGMLINPVGFSRAELDTIIIRKYAKGQLPGGFIDSLVLDSATNHYQFSATGDTARLFAFATNQLLLSKYDYQVYFPSANKLVTVTDITEPQQKMRKTIPSDETICINRIQSCRLNNELVHPGYSYHELLYINR